MKNFFKIFLIFLYFLFCFLLKDNIETKLSLGCGYQYSKFTDSVVQINHLDNSIICQNDNQEIINLQNSTNKNSADSYKKYNIFFLNNIFKYCLKRTPKQNILLANLKNEINTRAP